MRFNDERDWFFERRFGLFVHWGIYALAEWHEQDQWRRGWTRAEYARLAERWNPTRFEPDAWLDLAEAAGMEYVCFTTKHHDGFCLWDTKQTAFSTVHTPYRRDILRELADACRRRGFPLCLYYSCVDWNHPHYPNRGRHHELPGPEPGDEPDHARYLEFVRAQVRELCTGYGEIGGFWWDMNVEQHHDPSLNALIRELQPGAVINNRGYDEGDFGTPERDWDRENEGLRAFDRPTEACQSVGTQSWGYRAEEDFYTDRHLQRSIVKYLARGANYLLNVGPKADGTIPDESAEILRRLGAWYGTVREGLVGGVEPASHLTGNGNVLLTRRGDSLYVHLHRDPPGEAVTLKPFALAPARATLLNTGEAVPWTLDMAPSDHADRRGYLRLRKLPVNRLANAALAVRLDFAPGALDAAEITTPGPDDVTLTM
jgi:alpha-L-fucosidase